MITAVATPDPNEEPKKDPTDAEVVSTYRTNHKAALENVANAAARSVARKQALSNVASVVTAAAEKPAERVLDFDQDFKNFSDDGFDLAVRWHNHENLVALGIDPDSEDDTVFGAENIYCGAHRRVHGVGWCTVALTQKRPLKANDREAAITEAAALGLTMGDR